MSEEVAAASSSRSLCSRLGLGLAAAASPPQHPGSWYVHLQFRPTIELKETMLHEMIHAWIFLEKIRDQGDHGPRFQTKMNFINSATFADHQVQQTLASCYCWLKPKQSLGLPSASLESRLAA